jgi:hypothetical protein
VARCAKVALVRVVAFVIAGLGAVGCATTSGSAWVSQPEPGPFANDELGVAASDHPIDALDEPRSSRLVSELDGDAATPRGRPRLDRTVTLGEVTASYPEQAPPAPAERAPVSITINNYVSTTPNGDYDGYSSAPLVVHRPGHGGGRPHPAPRATPAHPGQNWPAIPNHGTSFPFKTAPASPWH